MAQESEPWHAENVKAEVRKRVGTLNELARRLNLAPGAVSRAIRRPDYSTVIERAIAEVLETPLHIVWPDRWHRDGTPKPRVVGLVPAGATPGGQDNAPRRPRTQRQKRKAA